MIKSDVPYSLSFPRCGDGVHGQHDVRHILTSPTMGVLLDGLLRLALLSCLCVGLWRCERATCGAVLKPWVTATRKHECDMQVVMLANRGTCEDQT